MALGFLKQQCLPKVIGLFRDFHFRFNDDNASPINYLRSARIAGDAHEPPQPECIRIPKAALFIF
jgi:hypothetical protein